MEPLTTSLAFATIVQLLCNFRQERSTNESAELADFLTWLTYHKFEQLSDQIQASSDIQIELQTLLREDYGDISAKLNSINDSIVRMATTIDGLSGLAMAFGRPTEELSDQAKAILCKFAESDAQQLGVLLSSGGPCCVLVPQNEIFDVSESRLLPSDVKDLVVRGYIEVVDYNSSGDCFYTLTRLGIRQAEAISQE